MTNFDKKIEQTLASLDGFEQIDMPANLEKKIRQRIENQRYKLGRIVPFRTVLLAAAVFVGIVLLNVASFMSSDTPQMDRVEGGRKNGVQGFASAYFNDSSLNY